MSEETLTEEKERIMDTFDKVFDDYNDKKISKVHMIKCCKKLFRKLMFIKPVDVDER